LDREINVEPQDVRPRRPMGPAARREQPPRPGSGPGGPKGRQRPPRPAGPASDQGSALPPRKIIGLDTGASSGPRRPMPKGRPRPERGGPKRRPAPRPRPGDDEE
ncbi:MAG TPA: hypothetical protein VFT74_03890, partial [Isosphaeraceae bacterium]|nr:hypothetical protein [Isosphaeraceae bacterium]